MNIFVTLAKQKSKAYKTVPLNEKKKLILLGRWIEDCLQDEIDPIIKLEETMRNGVVLARLANWFAPGTARKIFQVSKK